MPVTLDPKRKALGRGLETLLPTRKPSPAATAPAPAPLPSSHEGAALELDITRIDPNPYQTRSAYDEAALTELANSIQASGVIQPVIVRPHGDGRYHLIAGERRWMASQRIGKTTIPAIVKHVSPEKAMEMTIVENLQREDLNPMEQARAYERLGREFSLTQEEMARRTGKERASVANFLRLLKLPEPVQQKLAGGEISFGHAKVLLMLDSPESITKAAQKVVQLSMSVRQSEKFVHGILHPEDKVKSEKPERIVDPNVREAERNLQSKLGVKVQIDDRGGKGKITLEYASLEDFDRVLEILA
ncbi:MAG: ParB/RepB/Spo0J family partition protein [Acidobacteriales bacterium]|nr:ParB/RepB/Spo0J family partition protein [Terriglobales bacterium]